VKTLIAIIAIAGVAGNIQGAEPTRFEFEEPHMGTKIRIVLYSADRPAASNAARAAFQRFAEIEQVLSDYRPESEIMKLCKANDVAPGKPIAISNDLLKVMEIALEISKKSEGSFDVTVGPLSQLWRQTRKEKRLPNADTLTDAKAKVGWENVTLDANAKTLQLAKPGMRLDFGGIGKGFAAEESLAILKKHGITSALVAASGDISISDAPPGRDGWIVDVAPLNPKDLPRKLLLKNAAVSTSGDLFQHVEIDGVRYSHVLDPKTSLGLTGFRSATVIAKRGPYADALAKAASILPPEKAVKLIEEMKGATFIAVKESHDAKEVVSESPSFAAFLLK
jgi:thiamine biosynthesis lipoprotein